MNIPPNLQLDILDIWTKCPDVYRQLNVASDCTIVPAPRRYEYEYRDIQYRRGRTAKQSLPPAHLRKSRVLTGAPRQRPICIARPVSARSNKFRTLCSRAFNLFCSKKSLRFFACVTLTGSLGLPGRYQVATSHIARRYIAWIVARNVSSSV